MGTRVAIAASVFVFMFSFNYMELRAQVKFSPSKSEYRIGEELLVTYSNLPPLAKEQFYMILVLGDNGADLHDSKQLNAASKGSLKFKRLIKPGNFQVVLFKFKDKGDQRPEQISKVAFRAVSRVAALNEGVARVPDEPKAEPPQKSPPVAKATPKPAAPAPKKVVKKAKVVPVETEPVIAASSDDGEEYFEEDVLEEDSLAREERLQNIFASNTLLKELKPKVPPPPTYSVRSANSGGINDPIVLSYDFPKLAGDDYYVIKITKPGEDVSLQSSGKFRRESGTASFGPIPASGIYELKVMRGDGQIETPVFDQPLVWGDVNRQFPGRFNCIPRKPHVAGDEPNDGPRLLQVMNVFTDDIKARHLKPWLQAEDICIEIQGVEFLPSTKVTFPVPEDEITLPAFPVRFVYRVVLNDFTIQRSQVVEEARFKHLYFYKSGQEKWSFTSKPGTQDDLGTINLPYNDKLSANK